LLLAHVTTRPESGLPLASCGVAVSCTFCPVFTVDDAGPTLTEATGTGVTVIAPVPLLPSLVAVIVAEPAATPVTNPPLTVATPALLVVQVTTRPVSAFPLASLGVAVSWTVCPTVTVAEAGLTLTDATGTGVTVIDDVPLCPSLVAVMVAEPVATPVTNPLPLTVASPASLLAHVITRPTSAFPLASLGVAVSWTVCPAATVAEAGLTLTDATGTGVVVTVIVAVPFWPSLVAVIVAEPAPTPVTNPVPLTVASPASLVAHVTTRPQSTFPYTSRGVAASWTVCPAITLAEAGLTRTEATGRRRIHTHAEAESLGAVVVPETTKSPGVVSAANVPSDVMWPPVALQLTLTPELSPLLVRP
jgi:hypothetical protein